MQSNWLRRSPLAAAIRREFFRRANAGWQRRSKNLCPDGSLTPATPSPAFAQYLGIPFGCGLSGNPILPKPFQGLQWGPYFFLNRIFQRQFINRAADDLGLRHTPGRGQFLHAIYRFGLQGISYFAGRYGHTIIMAIRSGKSTRRGWPTVFGTWRGRHTSPRRSAM